METAPDLLSTASHIDSTSLSLELRDLDGGSDFCCANRSFPESCKWRTTQKCVAFSCFSRCYWRSLIFDSLALHSRPHKPRPHLHRQIPSCFLARHRKLSRSRFRRPCPPPRSMSTTASRPSASSALFPTSAPSVWTRSSLPFRRATSSSSRLKTPSIIPTLFT